MARISRKTDRTHVFNLVFQMLFEPALPPDELYERYFRLEVFRAEDVGLSPDCEGEYVYSTLYGIWERRDELDAMIARNAEGWELERLVKTDVAILRLAIYELLHNPNVPPGAAINEAVELAKSYSGGDSPSFVNGLLGNLARAGSESLG